jgi:hypothetical protein
MLDFRASSTELFSLFVLARGDSDDMENCCTLLAKGELRYSWTSSSQLELGIWGNPMTRSEKACLINRLTVFSTQ